MSDLFDISPFNENDLAISNSNENIKAKLKSVFGYDDFRPLQEEIVSLVLNKKDCMVIMPTGGGKSICYQLPALLFSGLTIVVSPLISLMEDQVNQLKQLGVRAALLNSSLDNSEYFNVLLELDGRDIDILYVAPETLMKANILSRLSVLDIDCLAIDEAHCVSEWGHDFRPEYRQLSSLREELGNPVVIALTATATARVQKDIIRNLQLIHPQNFLASFDRKNLLLRVESKQTSVKRQILAITSQFKNQSGIIYCFSRKKTDAIYHDLKAAGYSVRPYHAGLNAEVRKRNQDAFVKDKVQIIVATIAFGMGIDKSNVRFVIHADLPKNIESYYQEIGRAGRDSLDSTCVLLFSAGDMGKISHFIEQKEDEKEKALARAQLEIMVSYSESNKCRRIALLNYFDEEHSGQCSMCDNCLNPKELNDITEAAKKFLSCVYRTNQSFGMTYVIDVLRGSKSARVLEYRHNKVSTYGIGKEFSQSQWKTLARQFLNEDLLFSDPERYGVISITKRGYDVLKGDEKVMGVIDQPKALKQTAQIVDYDLTLFELLREKRTELADAAGLPPYVVFSDKSLIDMSANLPMTEPEFLAVNGVGEKKLEKFGSIFLAIIRSHVQSQQAV